MEETLHKTKNGWYWFRDYDNSGYGEYLYKCFQYTKHERKHLSRWVGAVLPYGGGPVVKYFSSRKQAIKALARRC